ncbi:MAG: 4Fe-4S binding protein [Bacteroidetes bacterium]|nr:4Fe-4S binding protein [Bacteroidota bacterium]
MQSVILKPLRYFFAMLFLLSTILLFTGLVSALPLSVFRWVTWLQFVPSFLKASTALAIGSAGFIVVLLITLFFGRIYCSFVCPLGTILDAGYRMRDLKSVMKTDTGKPNRNAGSEFGAKDPLADIPGKSKPTFHISYPLSYSYLHPLNAISFYLLLLIIFTFFFHNILLINLFDPFSIGGKIFALFRGSALMALACIMIFGLAGFFSGRRYCNMVCPAGMLLGFLSGISVFRISINSNRCKECGTCEGICKSSCIDHLSHRVDFDRCTACMNCLDSCSEHAVKYRYLGFKGKLHKARREYKAAPPADASRRSFLCKSAGGAAALTTLIIPYRFHSPLETFPDPMPVMPPGSISLKHFTSHCTACQLCVSSCPTHVLQPTFFEYGISGVFQPKLDFTRAFCRYDCIRCLEVCPSGAIQPLELKEKQKTQIGRAVFEKNQCLVVSEHKTCAKCSDHCPTKAIEMRAYLGDLKIPKIEEMLCNGCGACEFVCPVKPDKAIYVEANSYQRKLNPISDI